MILGLEGGFGATRPIFLIGPFSTAGLLSSDRIDAVELRVWCTVANPDPVWSVHAMIRTPSLLRGFDWNHFSSPDGHWHEAGAGGLGTDIYATPLSTGIGLTQGWNTICSGADLVALVSTRRRARIGLLMLCAEGAPRSYIDGEGEAHPPGVIVNYTREMR